ncbi:MAG: ABC transporter permease [Thiolinea sp.]
MTASLTSLTLTSISSPEFFVGYILILFFAVKYPIFPALANITPDMDFTEKLYRLFLPAMTMVLVVTAHMMRMTRASIISRTASPYIEMARLKGVPQSRVITHRPAECLGTDHQRRRLEPRLPDHRRGAGGSGVRVSGDWPVLVDSVTKRDFPVVQACCLIFAVTYILLNLLADVGSHHHQPAPAPPK